MPEEKPTKKKRLVRQSPQTVREQSERASQAATSAVNKKHPIRRLLGTVFSPLKFIWRPIRWLGRHLIPRYFRNSFNELRQVTWPNWRQTRQLTTAVVLFAVTFGVIVSILDFGLDKVFKKVFLKE